MPKAHPSVVRVVIQEDGRKQAQFQARGWNEPLDDLPGTLIFFVGVGPHQVEIGLTGVCLGQKVAAAGEIFQVEELVFFQAVRGLDVILVGMRSGRNAYVLTAPQFRGKAGGLSGGIVAANEFRAVIGMPDQIAQRDAPALQMLLVQQTVLPPDPLDGHVTDGQVEFAFQAGHPEGGQLTSQSQDLLLDRGGGFLRRVMGGAALVQQTTRAVLLVASPPLAHGEGASLKQPRGQLEASLSYRLDQSQAWL